MIKRIFCCITLIIACALLSGCWNYSSLDSMDIVSGVAVDLAEERNQYFITFEIVDTSSSDDAPQVKYVQSQGKTVFDAVRNAKKRLINKLYGGNTKAIVISRKIAETEGVKGVLEQMLRDPEPRETMNVLISREETARAVLMAKGIDTNIIAHELDDMITEDNRIIAATVQMPLYKAYNALNDTGSALVMPAIRVVENNEEKVTETDGIALFDGDKLIGFQPSADALWYLLIKDAPSAGVLSFPINEAGDYVSMEIKTAKSSLTPKYENEQLNVSLCIHLEVNITETQGLIDFTDIPATTNLEQMTGDYVKRGIEGYFNRVQREVGVDIFGIGRTFYQKSPAQWRTLESRWNQVFSSAQMQVEVEVLIQSTGAMLTY